MRKSFIFKNNKDQSETLYKQLMLKQKHGITLINQNSSSGSLNYDDPFSNCNFKSGIKSFVKSGQPPARDGHTVNIVGKFMIVFGGDRHHMPFNDMFILDLQKEVDDKSYLFK
jgi:hypothetical protein